MSRLTWARKQMRVRSDAVPVLIAVIVGANGAFILATTLLDQVGARHGSRLVPITVDLPLLIGVSLIYLSTLLRRRKRTAWFVTLLAYAFYLGLSMATILNDAQNHHFYALRVLRSVLLALVVVVLLLLHEKQFTVRSDIRGFRWAARFSAIILIVTFIYGTAGFLLFDNSDFHQEISATSAMHYTVDQFDLTTNHPIKPYTKRAKLFVDSLSFISVSAVIFVAYSLFQPLKLRLVDQTRGREHMHELLRQHDGLSEEFFKLWPHDKHYYFNDTGDAGIAYHVSRGVAVCVGDPVGHSPAITPLLRNFSALCRQNDWLPTFIHVEDHKRAMYEKQGFALQKIGQEAVVDIEHFQNEVVRSKYFRHIQNKFSKQGFTAELLQPSHHQAVLDRLQAISRDWLSQDGRAERGFAMGYYTNEYMQQCPIMVVRDAAGTIQAFMNQLPADFDTIEADFDLLRHTSNSMGNINDFLLLNFIAHLSEQGYKRLNLGLCPLVGLDEELGEETRTLIDSALHFAYANGSRFYSFDGLYRFKKKYEPEWRDRYVAYQGGIRGFSRSMTALMRAMRVSKSHLRRSSGH